MTRLLAILFATLAAMPAFAHDAAGGEAPQSMWHGFLGGLAHPVIGLDHLAFVVLVGLAAAGASRLVAGPAAFIAATLIGTLLHVNGVVLPVAWAVIGMATLVLAGLLIAGRQVSGPLALAGFAFAGLFHGWAYGAAVIGSTPMPIVAYLAGFGLIQFAISGVVALAARSLTMESPAWLRSHTVAAVCAGVGLAFFAIEAKTVAAGTVIPVADEAQASADHDGGHVHDHDHDHD
ncbi:HupE / UreJ protein [Roseovarius tolerans]|uniref:HupE / UreJ protein n=1 Tax=Roseovarius tolerans TaxID=74031 RepID=A0A0L6CR41_9RHOB|nr:HupE/UreJ family protein [Roseovarius tolerans]KNX40244.1 HupE / UreJ protein [Roseovarius tolerans]